LKGADTGQMGRAEFGMLTIKANPRYEGIGNGSENMNHCPLFVGVGHHLERRGTGRQYHIETASYYLARNGIGSGKIVFGIKVDNFDILSLHKTSFSQSVYIPAYRLVERLPRRELENGNPGKRLGRTVHLVLQQKQK